MRAQISPKKSNDELTVLLRAKFAEKERVEQTAEEILNICLNRGSIDNMTMIIIGKMCFEKFTLKCRERFLTINYGHHYDQTFHNNLNLFGLSVMIN